MACFKREAAARAVGWQTVRPAAAWCCCAAAGVAPCNSTPHAERNRRLEGGLPRVPDLAVRAKKTQIPRIFGETFRLESELWRRRLWVWTVSDPSGTEPARGRTSAHGGQPALHCGR